MNTKNIVKQTRTKLKISTSQLADKVGTTENIIRAVEKGTYEPPVSLAQKISTALNSTTDYIFNL